jgi:hypothetical protein
MREYRHLCRELDRLLYPDNKTEKYSHRPGFLSAMSPQQNCMVKARISSDHTAHSRYIHEYQPMPNGRIGR